MDEIIDGMIEAFLQSAMKHHINDIRDLYCDVPDTFRFIFLAALKVMLDSLLPLLSEHDRHLYEMIIEGSQTVVIKMPKRKEDDDEEA